MFVAIVPAYNEAKNISSVVSGLFNHVDEVIVVDDCSSDETSKIAKSSGAIVISHTLNRGQGAAIETGHSYARSINADYVLHFDGDGQFSVEDIIPAFENLKNSGADILLGSRFLGKESNLPFFKKHIILPFAKKINCIFSGANLSDAHNGFRILNKKALDTISIQQCGMAHATEITAKAIDGNLIILEFPVKVYYHEYGQRAVSGIKIIKDLLLHKFVH